MSATSQRVWGRATVVETTDAAHGVRRIVLQPEKPGPAAPPGSHIDLTVHVNGRSDIRSYSVVGMGERGTEYVLGVQLARESRGGSAFMHALRPGVQLTVTQPLQNFPLTYGRPSYVFLAGGIGVTALVAMAKAVKSKGADYRFVYGARSRDLMAFVGELAAEHGERLETRIDDEGTGLDVAELVAGCGPDTELYVCGPIPMLDAVKRAWAEAGRSPGSLRFETFGSSGRFDPEAFTVRIPRLGIETVVPRDASLLDALEAAGAEVIYDCRRGECGLCQVKVLEVAGGEIDHRDVFFSEEQHQTSRKMCACVSRGVSARTAGTSTVEGTALLTIDIP